LPRCLVGLLLLPGSLLSTHAQSRVINPKLPVRSAKAARPFGGYHRYRGTVGGQPVTVELTIGPVADNGDQVVCEGSYHYDRRSAGQLLLHGLRPFQPRRALALAETEVTTHASQPTGHWQAVQAAGPVLTGQWRSPAGKQLPFSLREDYTDDQGRLMAVQYEVVEAMARVPCRDERKEAETKAEYRRRIAEVEPDHRQPFLHLLGPDTLRPVLQALQCPGPAQRRRQVRAAAQEDKGCTSHTASLSVDYNAYGLLAWSEYWEDDFLNGARPQHDMEARVYDLRTGQELRLENVFRPGTDTLLQRLITRHILHDDNPDIWLTSGVAIPAFPPLAPLPGRAFTLAANGLEFCYDTDELLNLQEFVGGGAILSTVPVPYAELLPLLRPSSPLARMLRERGLWRLPAPAGPKR
jgi:hypothetical protein